MPEIRKSASRMGYLAAQSPRPGTLPLEWVTWLHNAREQEDCVQNGLLGCTMPETDQEECV